MNGKDPYELINKPAPARTTFNQVPALQPLDTSNLPPRNPKVSFELAPWSWGPLVLLAILAIITSLASHTLFNRSAQASPAPMLILVFALIAFFGILFALVAFIAFHIFSRSSKAASITFAALPLLLAAVLTPLIISRSSSRSISPQFDQALAQTDKRLDAAALSGDTQNLHKELANLAAIARKMEQGRNKIEAATGRVIRENAEKQSAVLATYDKAAAPIMDKDFYEVKTLKTDTHYEERLAALELARQANQLVRSQSDSMKSQVRQSLLSSGLSASETESFLKGARFDERLAAAQRMRELEDDFFTAMKQRLVVLQKNKGWWEWDASSRQLMFKNGKVLDQYNTLVERIDYLADEMDREQRAYYAKFE